MKCVGRLNGMGVYHAEVGEGLFMAKNEQYGGGETKKSREPLAEPQGSSPRGSTIFRRLGHRRGWAGQCSLARHWRGRPMSFVHHPVIVFAMSGRSRLPRHHRPVRVPHDCSAVVPAAHDEPRSDHRSALKAEWRAETGITRSRKSHPSSPGSHCRGPAHM